MHINRTGDLVRMQILSEWDPTLCTFSSTNDDTVGPLSRL